jgi:hypothetical protein
MDRVDKITIIIAITVCAIVVIGVYFPTMCGVFVGTLLLVHLYAFSYFIINRDKNT